MRFWKLILALVLLVGLVGCSSKGVVTETTILEKAPRPLDTMELGTGTDPVDGAFDAPVIPPLVDDEVIKTVVTETKEASVAKELAIHETLQNRDKMRVEAAKYSGFKMDWTAVEKTLTIADSAGKVTEIVMTEYLPNVSYSPQVGFENSLPTEPSRHPAWDTANQFVKTAGMVTLGIWGLETLNDMWGAGLAGAAASFGDNAQVNGSWNTAGRDMDIGTGMLNNYQGDMTTSEPGLLPEDEECWIDFPGGCSCESRAAGNC